MTETTQTVRILPEPSPPSVCPGCGRCRHCGAVPLPAPYQPYQPMPVPMPGYPPIWYGGPNVVLC